MNLKLNRNIVVLFLFLSWSFVLFANEAADEAADERLLATAHVFPGDVLTALVTRVRPGDDVLFMLKDEDGRVCSRAPGLILDLDEFENGSYGSEVFIGFLGVDSTLLPGQYELRCEVRSFRGLSIHERPVLLRSRDFIREDIPLNKSMTVLRSEVSDEKQAQSRKLWALLNEVSPGKAHEIEPFSPPVEDFVETAWYGDRRKFVYSDGNSASSIHYGLDMAAETGTEVRAPADGRVVMAENRIVTGWTIVLEHLPGIYTLYYHMDGLDVKTGDEVKRGDGLGTLGCTGLVTGPHLHWEMRVNTVAVDPKEYMKRPLIDKKGILSIMGYTKEKGR